MIKGTRKINLIFLGIDAPAQQDASGGIDGYFEENDKTMTNKMTFWGVGPKYTIYSAVYCISTVAISIYLDPYFKIEILPQRLLSTIGILLILIGLPFYIISMITIKKAFKEGRLVTSGTFGMCRHPVYSAWIVFFVPGIMLLINTWLGLTAPIEMYFLIELFAKEEEIYLENTFGNEYLAYKERIPKVLPIGWLMAKKK